MKLFVRSAVAVASVLTMGLSGVEAKEFLVGVDAPLTGALARVGTGTVEGMKAAVEIFNKNNPKHQMKLIVIDNENSPAKAVQGVEKLASQGAVGIMGAYGSHLLGPASTAANKAQLGYITSGGAAKELVLRGLKNYFSISTGEGYNKITESLLASWKTKSVSIIYSTKESTTDLAKDADKEMRAMGIKVTMHPFDPAIGDFKPLVNKVKLQDRPDVIYMCGYENDYVGILRASSVLKPKVKAIVGAWGLATAKMATDFPKLMPNAFGTAMISYPAEFKTNEGKELTKTYEKLYKKNLDYLTVYGYVPAMVMFEAIKRADERGTLNKGGVIEELQKTDKITLMGRITFDEKGENKYFSQRMGQHQNGKIVIVWPKEDATGKMKYPAVPW
jgi:branched-chain amino acid transport system substrate-binding protein